MRHLGFYLGAADSEADLFEDVPLLFGLCKRSCILPESGRQTVCAGEYDCMLREIGRKRRS
jgi:hypothetical protein